ncbi:hypothetical protein CHARACLAT_032932 [Characodon lateralis]|uniref:Uncharacterized protein n=1 Tax=Characodon lateralis TaxID=208331 RepID=A0ABU7DXE0_9TELE|nr:hypothetical protein [Characodon lateralis]
MQLTRDMGKCSTAPPKLSEDKRHDVDVKFGIQTEPSKTRKSLCPNSEAASFEGPNRRMPGPSVAAKTAKAGEAICESGRSSLHQRFPPLFQRNVCRLATATA